MIDTTATSRHRGTVVLVTLAGVVITLALFGWAWHAADVEYRQRFNYDANIRSETVADYLDEQSLELDGLKRFVEGKTQIDAASFQAFVKPMLDRRGVQAVEWIPAVTADKRAELESARENGLRITERAADGTLVAASQRGIYYPVHYVVPLKGNEKAVGFDLGSNPQRLEAIRAALKSGLPQATPRITLVQEKGKQFGFLVFSPVYKAGTHAGFALGVYRAGDMLENAIKKTESLNLDTRLMDLSAQPEDRLLTGYASGKSFPHGILNKIETLFFPHLTSERVIDFAGRKWSVIVATTPAYSSGIISLYFLAILPGGLLLTLLLVLYINSVLSHRDRAEILVRERTKELAEKNELLNEHLAELEQTREHLQDQSAALEEEMIERQNVQNRVNEINQRFSLAADSAKIGVWDWDVVENRLTWDLWMYSLYGIREADFAGAYEAWQNGLHPDDRASGDEAIRQALRGEKDFDSEFRVVWPSGEIRHIKGNAIVWRDASGNPLRMIGVNYDITGRKKAELEQKKSSEMLSLILNSTAEAIYGIDMKGDCTFCNQACLDILGYDSQDELLGKNMHDQIHHTLPDGSHFPVHDCKIFKAFQIGEGAHVDDELFWRRDGTSFPAEYWSYPQHKDGEIVGAVITFFDITERRQMLEELCLAVSTAESANRAKSQFLANMSHEIRTPMNAVLGMLHLLQRTELSARQLDYAHKIQLASQTLLSILNDILDFSKIEAGRLELENAPFSLSDLFRNLSVILSSAVQDKDVEVLFSIAPDIPHSLRGDGLRLQQVLLNLASNAIKFTEQGEVVISVTTAGTTADRAQLEFSVRDTGIGIAPDMLDNIFAGFVQAEASTTRRFGGTGLGLSISSQLVGLMGGELAVDSEHGKGSTFHFTITFDRAADTGLEKNRPVPPDHPVTALIVDDNAIAREVLAAMVASFGWHAETAESGSRAIALVEQQAKNRTPYDIIFMDWKMPGMDGLETSGRIKALPHGDKAPVVIMVTAHGREFLTENHPQEDSPLDSFLVKPVTPSMLFDAVADVTSGRSRLINKTTGIICNTQRLTGLRILVAEDNPINQQVAEEILIQEGATVKLASTGRQAVEAVTAGQPFHAILMDIQMPDMDGYQATLHIRNVLNIKELPIIAMTANAMSSDRERCLEAGMNDHVGKPFDVDRLIEVLRRNIGITGQPETITAIPLAPGGKMNRRHTDIKIDSPPGLDCEAALKRLGGNRSLYARMMRAFETEQQQTIDQLHLHLQQYDTTNAAHELHTIKGVAATLGATDLSAAAAKGETQLKNSTAQTETEAMLQEIEHLFAEACTAFRLTADRLDPPSAEAETAGMDSQTATAALTELETLLREGNMKAIQIFQDIRSGLPDRDIMPQLDQAMQRLDFAAAADMCGKMKEGMG